MWSGRGAVPSIVCPPLSETRGPPRTAPLSSMSPRRQVGTQGTQQADRYRRAGLKVRLLSRLGAQGCTGVSHRRGSGLGRRVWESTHRSVGAGGWGRSA